MDAVKSFREVRQKVLDEDITKRNLADLEGKTIIVREYRLVKSDAKGELYRVFFEEVGQSGRYWFFTRTPWMTRYKDVVPFKAKVVKRTRSDGGSYFAFDEP